METSERFNIITSNSSLPFEQKVDQLLELGLDVFGLGIALVSRVEDDIYTVKFAKSPDDMIAPGTQFPVGETYCWHTLQASRGLAFHNAGQSDIASHPCYINFQLESYIGAPIVEHGQVTGTVNFSAAAARYPFTSEEIALTEKLAKWLGEAFEQQRSE